MAKDPRILRGWTAEKIALFRLRWVEGVPLSEIERELGISRRAAAGVMRALTFGTRPAPITTGFLSRPLKNPRGNRPHLRDRAKRVPTFDVAPNHF
jgi:hypothetical protein